MEKIRYADMTPQQRVAYDIENSDPTDAGHFLLEHLAAYGADGIDAQALAQRVFARVEEEG